MNSKSFTITHCSLATVEQLFRYKEKGNQLKPFPGYSPDQWGIKAHNRPWVIEEGNFKKDMNVIEIGGAYSTLPLYLAETFKVNAWVGDDFGEIEGGERIWQRWGDPKKLAQFNQPVRYIYKPLGIYSAEYPDNFFDRVYSVSTLEHISKTKVVDVIKDMNRITKPDGIQLHTIDLSTHLNHFLTELLMDKLATVTKIRLFSNEIIEWIKIFQKARIKFEGVIPSLDSLLDRKILVESPDVVYRLYPPNNQPKIYQPNASLLIIVKSQG